MVVKLSPGPSCIWGILALWIRKGPVPSNAQPSLWICEMTWDTKC